MTGEIHSIDQTGLDSNGDSWPIHAAIAQALGGKLKPFDVYQGPYIQTKQGNFWVYSPDGELGIVYNETREESCEFFPIHDEQAAIEAALSLWHVYKCADPDCPGLPYKASEQSHQGTCKS